MTKFRPLPSRERLIELFEYNQKEGALYWRQRHNSQIDICKPAGWLQQNGYHGIRADGASYKRHRIVWCYFNGDPGELEIDHINGIKNDDRIENLRLATRSQNQYNRPPIRTNKTGYKGVSRHHRKWRAQITDSNGRNALIGSFDTPEEAAAAYAQASLNLHGEFAHSSIFGVKR